MSFGTERSLTSLVIEVTATQILASLPLAYFANLDNPNGYLLTLVILNLLYTIELNLESVLLAKNL